jgi:pilus assembly protein Flp/PilA
MHQGADHRLLASGPSAAQDVAISGGSVTGRSSVLCRSRAGQLAPEGGERTVHVSKLLALVTRADWDDENGQGLAEYALILALIAIVSIIALLFLGGQISEKLSVIGDNL